MPKIKGGKTSVKKLKQRTARSGDFSPIWNIKADDELTVRFITEPDEWFGYEEYWDDEARAYVPVVDGDEQNPDARLKYLCNVVLLDKDRVVALKLPKSLASTLLSRYDKFGTIMDREYELIRSGKGLDTSYEAINEGPSKFSFKKYDSLDLLDILESEWDRANGEEDSPKKPKKKGKKKGKGKSKKNGNGKSKKKGKSKSNAKKSKKKDSDKKGRKRGKPEPEEEEPEEEELESWDEDELDELTVGQLRNVAKERNIKTTGLRKADLVEAILEEQPF